MTNIGVSLERDQLVLTRGRDFKWTFTNLDANGNPIDFPAGQLFFEISTHGEQNASQHIDEHYANGGTWKIGMPPTTTGGDVTWSIDMPFDASEAVVQGSIGSLPGIGGPDNVSISSTYVPQWIFKVEWNATVSLSAGTVQLFNSTVTAAFNTLNLVTGGVGVVLSGVYTSTSFEFMLTYQGTLLETEIVNFAGGVISTVISTIQSAINAVETFTGFIGSVSLIYAPSRHWAYTFVNDMSYTPVPALEISSSLTGDTPTLTLTRDTPGLAPYTVWPFVIDGSQASLTVEAADADAIANRTLWQLVFLATGAAESSDPLTKGTEGGDAVARGTIYVQAER